MTKRALHYLFTLFLSTLLSLTACSGGKMANMTSAELAAKRDECLARNPTSPGKVTACENVRKECERRRKDGDFAC